MFKKISALTVALVIAGSSMTACSKKDNSDSSSSVDVSSAASQSTTDSSAENAPDPKLVIDGEEVDTEGLIICTVDGRDVDFDTFRYYYENTLSDWEDSYGITLDSLKETENGFENLLTQTVSAIMQDYVTYRICEENSLTLTDEEKQANEDTYNSSLETAGSEENFEQSLKNSYMTPELYKQRLELAALYVKAEDELFTNEGVYATTKDEFREIAQDTSKYACVRTIYIPYWCKTEITDESTASAYDSYSLDQKNNVKKSAYESLSDSDKEEQKKAAKEVAEACLEKVNNGEDFDELLDEYNWDSLQESYEQGEFMSPDSNYNSDYLDAVFALDEGETSGLIENESFGWTIIKRLPMDMDYVEENIDELITSYDLPARQQLYSDILDDMKVTYSDTYEKLTIDSIT